MPRPTEKTIQLTIDGREIQAVEGTMLVDAAKQGDVEIPYFCYEPKLGNPVGACRMCLVEIEGIPKLQTSCSTPVKDGMVVHTQTDRVRHAQNAVVEFLLVNHPLDCPVCDKGGECPLQDITFGWGLGRSRFIEPKRHFEKPLALSPLVAIDRERCILCYRCVRFSQEVSEDYQLIFAERGAHTFVTTFDGHPYVAPFSGNIVELCPVGALTSRPYRFRARPWDIEQAGGVCTLCPSQCNVSFTVRDEKVMRVLARDHDEVDDGWLCDKGRFAYQAIHVDERITQPLVRDGGELRPVSWERALETAAGLGKHRGRVGTLVGGQATNEEAFLLQRLSREVLDSNHIDSRVSAGPVPVELARALANPALQATVPDLEYAHTVLVVGCEPLDDAPILDLRIRKGVRRRGVQLVVASARPSALDVNATQTIRYAPGSEAEFLSTLASELGADEPRSALAKLLREGGEDVVILWGERLGADAAQHLLSIASALGLADRTGAGLLEVPVGANARGIREAGAVPDHGPGYSTIDNPGRSALDIAQAAVDGEITALHLFATDPLRDHADRALWEQAMHHAALVVAHASVLTDGLREHANVIFPAESYAEKQGTLVHPDGRLQRLRTAIAHPGEVRAGWSVIADIAKRAGNDLGVLTASMAWKQLSDAVPFYKAITLEDIGGRGVRWPERDEAKSIDFGGAPATTPTTAAAAQETTNGALRLGRYRPIWASPEVEISPALHFTIARQQVELSPEDAQRLGIASGDDVAVAQNGTRLKAKAHVRTGVPEGTAFLAEGLEADSANALTEPTIEISKS
jgi:NADH-quinone oxidoreductase subunit G